MKTDAVSESKVRSKALGANPWVEIGSPNHQSGK